MQLGPSPNVPATVSPVLDAVAVRIAECPEAVGYTTEHPDGDVFTRCTGLAPGQGHMVGDMSKGGWTAGDQRQDQQQPLRVRTVDGNGGDDASFNEFLGMTDGGWMFMGDPVIEISLHVGRLST